MSDDAMTVDSVTGRRRRPDRRAWWTTALLLAVACESPPRPADGGIDPRVYRRCTDPELNAAWQRGAQALARGAAAEALPDLRRVAERCPDLVPAQLAYQDAALAVGGDAATAMTSFVLAMPEHQVVPGRASPVPAYLKARLADTSYAQGNTLESILAADPSFAWAHLSRARVSRKQGQLLAAIDGFGRAIANDPELHEALLERARLLFEVGREEEAARDYGRYVASVPDDDRARREYAQLLLYRLERGDEALALLEVLRAHDPQSVALRMDEAAAQWLAGRPLEAVRGYLAILRDHPDTARAAYNLGLLYYEVLPKDEAGRRRYWPRARNAFARFLATGGSSTAPGAGAATAPTDGHEQFERTIGVPYRLKVIADLLGAAPEPAGEVPLESLQLPPGG